MTERKAGDSNDEPTRPHDSGPNHEQDDTIRSDDATLRRPDEPIGAPTIPAQPRRSREEAPTAVPPVRADDTKLASEPAVEEGDGTLLARRFQIERTIGQGGMGRVFEVRDRQIEGRRLALKLLLPRFTRSDRFRQLFFQEIRASQNFVSEHVIQVRDTGSTEDGQLYLTMDLVDGESLRGMLEREDKLQPRQALEVARQMLLGLASGHEKGFVHRDVKPSNVMLASRVPKTEHNPFGIGVKLLDFGIARVVAELDEGISGTPMYMSPEQTRGENLDPRSDLFSVGIVLYEMLTGSRPFEGTTLEEIQTSVVETNLAPAIAEIENLRKPERKLLRKALQKDREKRFSSASEFIAAIERSKSYKRKQGVPVWVAAGLGVALAGAGAEAWVIRDMDAKNDGLRDELATERAAHTAALEKQRSEFEGREQVDEATIQELTVALSEANTKLEGKRVEEVAGGEVDAIWEDRIKAVREESAAEVQQYKTLVSELTERVEELEREVRLQNNSPGLRAARGYGQVLEYLARSDPAAARTVFDQQSTADGDFALIREERHGGGFVESLIKTASMVEGVGAGAVGVVEASAQLDRTKSLFTNFDIAASTWLEQTTESTPPKHHGTTAALLDRYAAALNEANELAVASDGEAWERYLAEPHQDPATAFRIADRSADYELAKLLSAYAVELELRLIDSGRLDVAALAEEHHIAAWIARLDTAPSLAGDAATLVRTFAAALDFYHGADYRSLSPRLRELVALEVSSREPVWDWKQELLLKAAAYESVEDRMRVFRLSKDGKTRRWVSRQDGGKTGEETSEIVENRYHVDGDYDRSFSLTLRHVDRTFRLSHPTSEEQVSLDLGAPTRVALWIPEQADDVPRLSKIRIDGDDARAFAERCADGIPCLVQETSSGETLWVSPRHGLLEKESTSMSWQLVYSDANEE